MGIWNPGNKGLCGSGSAITCTINKNLHSCITVENNVKHKTTNWGNNGRLGSGSAITCTMVKSKTEWWYDYKNNFLNKQLEVKIVL